MIRVRARRANTRRRLLVQSLFLSLFVAASASAQTVEVNGSGDAIAIKNIDLVYANNTDPVLSDVDFQIGTAADVYGESYEFDVLDEEAIFGNVQAINNALNAANPVPMIAGDLGYTQFFMGEDIQSPVVSAVGGEYFASPDLWDQCDTDEPPGPEGEECIFGVASILETEVRTWAKIMPAESAAESAAVVTAVEIEFDVVFTVSGDVNLDAWMLAGTIGPSPTVDPSQGNFLVGEGGGPSADLYATPDNFGGPLSFGSGISQIANSGSGGLFGLTRMATSGPQLTVPLNYVSGEPLPASTATYQDHTFDSLGMTPGEYEWTWGSGDTAGSLTLVVPEPSAAALATAALATLGLIRARRRRR